MEFIIIIMSDHSIYKIQIISYYQLLKHISSLNCHMLNIQPLITQKEEMIYLYHHLILLYNQSTMKFRMTP